MSKNFWKMVAVGSIGYALGVKNKYGPRYGYTRPSIIENLKARINDKVNAKFGYDYNRYPIGGRPLHTVETEEEEDS